MRMKISKRYDVALLLCCLVWATTLSQAQEHSSSPQLQTHQQPTAQPMSQQESLLAAVNQRLNDALRERDAIIRNLLERVQELEWRVNGGFTTSPKDLINKPVSMASSSAPAAPAPRMGGASAAVT